MKKRVILFFLMAFLLFPGSNGFATTIFSDNFDSENGGAGALNYNNFTNWTITDGTVDLIGPGLYDYLPGNGFYVDLDGSTSDAGVMTTKTIFAFEPGYNYTLSFDLAGSQRGDENTVSVLLGSIYTNEFTLASSVPLQTNSYGFTVTSSTNATLSFSNAGGDNYGALLDNVSITSLPISNPIPEPATMLLLGSGLIGLAGFRKKIKK